VETQCHAGFRDRVGGLPSRERIALCFASAEDVVAGGVEARADVGVAGANAVRECVQQIFCGVRVYPGGPESVERGAPFGLGF
jgi:hypothetical protein